MDPTHDLLVLSSTKQNYSGLSPVVDAHPDMLVGPSRLSKGGDQEASADLTSRIELLQTSSTTVRNRHAYHPRCAAHGNHAGMSDMARGNDVINLTPREQAPSNANLQRMGITGALRCGSGL